MNKKYAVFGAAAAIAIAGVIYFGTSANQQASVANVASKYSIPTPIDEPTVPTTGPIMTEIQWRKLCRDKQPHIQVLSPNGGEVYQIGGQMSVKWRSCNISNTNNVWFHLLNQNTLTGIQTIQLGVNDGNQLITLPVGVTDPSHSPITSGTYKARVGTLHPNTQWDITDESDNTFTINQATKVSVKTSVTNPPVSTVLVSQIQTTNNVRLLGFTVGAFNGDVYLKKIPIQVKSTGSGIQSVVKSFKLVDGNGNIIQTVAGTSGNLISSGTISTTAGCTIKDCGYVFFNFGTIIIPSGTTKEFSILAEIRAINTSTGDATRTLKTSIVNNDIITPTNFGVTNQNGDSIITSTQTGSALGNVLTFTTVGTTTNTNTNTNTGTTSTTNPTTDVCPNIPGVQTSIPSGMTIDSNGNCV